jgi:hypothetical protein
VKLTSIERRVLAYLDQRGPSHRANMAADLARDDSNTARCQNGSNGAVPLIVGAWCRRLIPANLVTVRCDGEGYYRHHEITAAGAAAIRAQDGEGGR